MNKDEATSRSLKSCCNVRPSLISNMVIVLEIVDRGRDPITRQF